MDENLKEMECDSLPRDQNKQTDDLIADTSPSSNTESELRQGLDKESVEKEEESLMFDKLTAVSVKEHENQGDLDTCTNKDNITDTIDTKSNAKPETDCDKSIQEEHSEIRTSLEDSKKAIDITQDDVTDVSSEKVEKVESDGEYFSDQSESGDEYESAEEGEEIQMDSTQLREMEEKLTDEEKGERRDSAKNFKEEGNQLYKDGSYKSAIRMYSRGLRTCPLKFEKDRAILYANRGACKWKLDEQEEAIKDCSKAIDLNPEYMKALVRRAELYEKTDKLDEALADYQKILELDPSNRQARAACMKLPDMIKERNEKLKEEMMGKLKDLGNMVLRPFGLSTNNFKLNQDPNTGGYSVNFVQNAGSNS